MTQKDVESNIETRQRILEAAGEVFAEVGFQRATVRDICQRAGANVAAVNYHFRDKEGLYIDVLRFAQVCAMQNQPTPDPAAPAERKLRGFIGGFLTRAIGPDRLAWHGKLMAKEMSEPTGMLDRIVESEIRPRAAILESIVAQLLGPGTPQWRVEACARSVIAQCIFYHVCRPVIDRLYPNQKYEPADVQALADHITAFSLGAMRGLAETKGDA